MRKKRSDLISLLTVLHAEASPVCFNGILPSVGVILTLLSQVAKTGLVFHFKANYTLKHIKYAYTEISMM